jgi:hypothetical protein
MSRKSSLLELEKEYEKVLMEQNMGIESSGQNVLLKNALSPSSEQMASMVNKADVEREKCSKCEAGSCTDHKTISFTAPKVEETEEEEECEDCDPNMQSHEDSNLDMAKSEVFKIKKSMTALCMAIQQSCKIEPWMLAKLVKASDYLCSVSNVLEYDNYEKQVEQPVQDFSNDMHLVSRITGMLNGEGREVNEAVLKRTIFNLEMINNK